MNPNDKNPVLHIIVVGFHHKKGCQVEYAFPPLVEGGSPESNECPPGWKYLPTLALPDGSHNFEKDTAFFHVPSLHDPNRTIFGISCFRQIPVEKLKNRTADLTRGTVQKSVCVLSLLPLYGHIQVKMTLITHAYFEEGDFTKVSLLQDTYHHLNSCLQQMESLYTSPQLYVGLSARDLILRFRHKALLLFKLLLLERRTVMFCSPVQPLCSTILSLLSLHPGMIEKGLHESACIRPSRPMSPVPEYPKLDESANETVEESVVGPDSTENAQTFSITGCDNISEVQDDLSEDALTKIVETKFNQSICSQRNSSTSKLNDANISLNESSINEHIAEANLEYISCKVVENCSQIIESVESYSVKESDISKLKEDDSIGCNIIVENNIIYEDEFDATKSLVLSDVVQPPITNGKNCSFGNNFLMDETVDIMDVHYPATCNESVGGLPRNISIDTLRETTIQDNLSAIAQMDNSSCGVPLPIFTKGYLCLPYLSLPYLDLLGDQNVRGYIVGATNILFKQKKQIAEVIIEVDEPRIETNNPELRRILNFSTEDLRFADYLVRHVADERHDVFLDGVGWEGGDEWIRSQFKSYLLCLLRTSLLPEGSREIEHFNSAFVSAWRETDNYKTWLEGNHEAIYVLMPGHPFTGQLSVADVKLRFSHTIQNTEGGRKLNAAVQNTSRAVVTTSKAVGGAITQAKGAFTNWWSNFTMVQPLQSVEDEVVDSENVKTEAILESKGTIHNV